jgi:Skp family chaperone for outer membrane proteins
MRRSLAIITAAGIGVAVLAISTGWAQRPAAVASSGVALVNVAEIGQKLPRILESVEALKKEYQAQGESLKKEGERGNAMTEQMRKLPPGPERKKMEADLAKMRADFELRGKKITEEAADRESKIYLSVSKEIQEELTRYAAATGTQLVLRYEPSPTEFIDRQTIAAEIQKLVIYHRDPEITPQVIDAINRRPATGGAARAPAATRSTKR